METVTPKMPSTKKLVAFFPLHLPHNLAAIKALAERHPALPQVACFDNSFHSTQPRVAQLFALPRRMFEHGVRRYGFHGLSYEFIARTLPEYAPEATRVVVAHLGSGASLCALRDGKSVESTLGFSGLDGLPMGTRPGALDPGVMLYLLQALGMDAKAIERLLYTESRGRKRRSSCSFTTSQKTWARSLRSLAASMPWCLPPASANTRPKFGNVSATALSGSGFAPIPLQTLPAVPALRPRKALSRRG